MNQVYYAFWARIICQIMNKYITSGCTLFTNIRINATTNFLIYNFNNREISLQYVWLHLCVRYTFSQSVQFSQSVVSDSLWPHEPQNSRPPCPSPTPRVHQNPCPSSGWCHPTISPSVCATPPFQAWLLLLKMVTGGPTDQILTMTKRTYI